MGNIVTSLVHGNYRSKAQNDDPRDNREYLLITNEE